MNYRQRENLLPNVGVAMAIGAGFGIVAGVFLDNIALGIVAGAGLGVVAGAAIQGSRK